MYGGVKLPSETMSDDYENRREDWARRELSRAIAAWKKDRNEWLERAFRFVIALNAGGLATGLAFIGARLEKGVPITIIVGLILFLSGLCGSALVSIANYQRAATKAKHFEDVEFEAYNEPGIPVSILIDVRQPMPDDSPFFSPLSVVLYLSISAFVFGAAFYIIGLWGLIGKILSN